MCGVTSAVFLRAVNVGAHQRVSVAAVANALGYANIGAAGTFVAPPGSAAAVRKAVTAELGSETDVMVVPAKQVLDLVEAAPLSGAKGKPHVAVLARTPRAAPTLPVEDKGVRVVDVRGAFALCLVLPSAKPGAGVNALVDRTLGVPATTRNWATMERVAEALR